MQGIPEHFPALIYCLPLGNHLGPLGMVAIMEGRITTEWNLYHMRPSAKTPFTAPLKRGPVDYFRMFYADTALKSLASLNAECAFFGVDHVWFGVDSPFDREFGGWSYRITLDNIARMELSAADKKKILEENARKLLRLPV